MTGAAMAEANPTPRALPAGFCGPIEGRPRGVYIPPARVPSTTQRRGTASPHDVPPRRFAVPIRVGINGFGRIGRLTYRAIYEKYGLKGDVQVVALNDLTDAKTNAHLLEFDSNYGPFKGQVGHEGNDLLVDGHKIHVFAEKDPGAIPWGSQDVQIVVESTGFFTDATKAVAHKRDSVKKVIISAPAKNEDLTLVLGVNNEMYDPKKHHVISNASCTTNGLAPVAKVLHETWGIDRGLLTTVHAYTNSQKTVDTAAKDLRDARAAALNIVPSSTGAAKAVGLVIPALQGKFTGMAFRVPTPTVSVVDFTALLTKDATPAEINAAMKKAAEGPLKGILRYTEKELVSTDLKGDPHSSIFSAVDTIGLGNFVKVVSWYDNEWGYSNRVADLLNFLEDKGL
jgi:glyceraldehyde 3-phosphate dehydrogenase